MPNEAGTQCSRCGAMPEVSYHLDGSYASSYHHCPNAPAGPPSIPRRYPAGQFFPASQHERELGALKAEVLNLRGQIRSMRKATFEALGMRLPHSQQFAVEITEAEIVWRDGQRATEG